MTIISPLDAADQVIASGAPVLLIDTCSLLDIVRVPIRDEVSIHDITAMGTLLSRAAASPPQLTLLINEQVHYEFSANVDNVERDTEKEIAKLSKRVKSIYGRIGAFPPISAPPANTGFSNYGFPARGRKMAEEILKLCLIVADDDAQAKKALLRVNNAIPPATRAKQSAKDCIIIETYLYISSFIHSRNQNIKKIFITANKDDYQQGHSSLAPSLRAEFCALGLAYSPNWSAARFELDRP